MNTARMLQKFAEGVKTADEGIEVKTYRLYDLDDKGCMACKSQDPLTPIQEEIARPMGLCWGKDYNRFELASFSEPAKRQRSDSHWQADLQNAFDAGRKMAGY